MRVACITGISRGLGESLFLACLDRLDHVIGIGRTFTGAQRAAEADGRARLIDQDLAQWDEGQGEALRRVLPAGISKLVFFSNAAVLEAGRIGDGSALRLQRALQVNCVAAAGIAETLAAHAGEKGYPLVVANISSGAARRPVAGLSAYSASKAAADMFFDCLAAEHPGVRVQRIDPGILDTGMQAEIRSTPSSVLTEADQFRRLHSEGRLRDPQSAARDILAEAGIE